MMMKIDDVAYEKMKELLHDYIIATGYELIDRVDELVESLSGTTYFVIEIPITTNGNIYEEVPQIFVHRGIVNKRVLDSFSNHYASKKGSENNEKNSDSGS